MDELIRTLETIVEELLTVTAQDADEQGEHWVTLKNGAKVLIGGDGTVIAGMGGKFNGKKVSDIPHGGGAKKSGGTSSGGKGKMSKQDYEKYTGSAYMSKYRNLSSAIKEARNEHNLGKAKIVMLENGVYGVAKNNVANKFLEAGYEQYHYGFKDMGAGGNKKQDTRV